jgi:hypothetical protein
MHPCHFGNLSLAVTHFQQGRKLVSLLSYCRMLHDQVRGYPGSKREGAEWAITALDPEWADLIDGSWEGRPDPARKVKQPPDPEDFERTLRFVGYVMELSEEYMTKNQRD